MREAAAKFRARSKFTSSLDERDGKRIGFELDVDAFEVDDTLDVELETVSLSSPSPRVALPEDDGTDDAATAGGVSEV